MIRTPFFRSIALLALPLAAAGCDRVGADVTDSSGGSDLPPPAAALSAEGGISLESRLEQLDADLARVIEAGLNDESEVWLLSAEATTDRLLEDEPAATWLSVGYLVEARLRQLQALADRTVAELRRGVAKELVLEDVAALRTAVRDLRTQLQRQGNGDAPPPLDSLLINYANDRTGLGGVPATSGTSSGDTSSTTTTTTPAEPTVAPEGGPLGQPIRP